MDSNKIKLGMKIIT